MLRSERDEQQELRTSLVLRETELSSLCRTYEQQQEESARTQAQDARIIHSLCDKEEEISEELLAAHAKEELMEDEISNLQSYTEAQSPGLQSQLRRLDSEVRQGQQYRDRVTIEFATEQSELEAAHQELRSM